MKHATLSEVGLCYYYRKNNVMVEEVVRKYSDMLYRLALAKTGNTHDAEDIIQEVFLKLVTSNKSFNDDEHQKAWLIRVTINAGKNLVKSSVKQKEVAITESYNLADDFDIKTLETHSLVYPAVMSLDEKYRVIIHLFYYEDMQITDICKATGLGENTVKSRLHRARNILKEKLKGVDFS
ncbi:MAG: sigma-70 family RNA polymerase sigma factor [Oscillospiraceae bacterium]|nr:sigma-70 family RNA polymerase sigma factor [Oscillospiraceae bacterium]